MRYENEFMSFEEAEEMARLSKEETFREEEE